MHKYSTNHDLPIRFVIEDNGKSVCTDTREVWNTHELTYEKSTADNIFLQIQNILMLEQVKGSILVK